MADQDWDTIGQELYTLLGPNKESGELWKAWVRAKEIDADELHDAAWRMNNDEEMWAYMRTTVSSAETAYDTFHRTWLSTFEKDKSNITVMKSKAETWDREVAKELRRAPQDTAKSQVAESWYGESAQKYATALQAQTGALTEVNTMAGVLANGLNDTRKILQGLYLAIKNSCVPVRDKLNGVEQNSWASNSFHKTYMENVAYGEGQFKNLRDWLQDLASTGDWKNSMETIQMRFEDTKKDTAPFVKDTWPKATTGNMQSMQNGKQAPAGGQSQQTSTAPQNPYAAVDTNSDDGGGPAAAEQVKHQAGMQRPGISANDDAEAGETIDPNAPK